MQLLSSYPNVFNTCLVLLQRQGFTLTFDRENDAWFAQDGAFRFRGDNPIELLGLATIYRELKPSRPVEYWWQIITPNLLQELAPEEHNEQ